MTKPLPPLNQTENDLTAQAESHRQALSGTAPAPSGSTDKPLFPSETPSSSGQTVPPMPSAPPAGFNTEQPPATTETPEPTTPGALFTGENTADLMGSMQDFRDKAPEVTPEQTVQGQLEGILDKNNALFDWARGQAGQYANSRGLQNSDMAAEASSQAVIGAALPIAQADASVFADRAAQEARFWQAGGLQAMEGTIKSTLMAQDHLQQLVAMSHQGDVNSRLQLEQFGYNWNLSEQDNIQRMQQMALQGDINARLALQQFGFDTDLMEQDFGFRSSLMDKELRNALSVSEQDHTQWLDRMAAEHTNTLAELQVRSDLDSVGYGRALQQNYLSGAERMMLQFSQEVQAIYQQEGLTAAQQANAVNRATVRHQNDMAMLQQYYMQSPHWDTNWGAPQQSPTPPQQEEEEEEEEEEEDRFERE